MLRGRMPLPANATGNLACQEERASVVIPESPLQSAVLQFLVRRRCYLILPTPFPLSLHLPWVGIDVWFRYTTPSYGRRLVLRVIAMPHVIASGVVFHWHVHCLSS
jgi:hypothetical protein